MITETSTETQHTGNHLTMACSDSDEEYSQVEPPVTPWSDLSIVERVGLNTTQMSEDEIESAFCQITLAFRTDQYTLKQRLQAEERARNMAEENIEQELSRGRETLEDLKALCLDIRRSAILQKLELSLDIVGGTVGRISTTAELLGSVHQEARICRAVEIMVSHVENLKRRHEREGLELEQTKKLVHRISRRCLTEPGTPIDVDVMELQKQDQNTFQKYNGRRRVSTSIITKESQEKRKRDLKKQLSLGDEHSPSPTFSSESNWSVDQYLLDGRLLVEAEEAPQGLARVRPVRSPSPLPDPQSPPPPPPPPPSAEEAARKTRRKSCTVETVLRQRHRGRASFSKRKGVNHFRSSISSDSAKLRPFPLAHWLVRSRWAILYVALLLILCAAMVTLFS
ncbi:unnamed protein product [Arctogadus glacialis]